MSKLDKLKTKRGRSPSSVTDLSDSLCGAEAVGHQRSVLKGLMSSTIANRKPALHARGARVTSHSKLSGPN